MIRKRLWHVRDKWARHRALAGNHQLSRHIPPTRLLNRNNLNRFMERYREVFIKPVNGSFGNNIIKVTRQRNGYVVHRERFVKRVVAGEAAGELFRRVRGRKYLIQRGVSLVTIQGKPVDYRLLLLRPGAEWQIMGIMGKVATGNRIVTNYNHGGRPVGLERSLRQAGWSLEDIQQVHRRMNRIGLTAAREFNKKYPHCRRLGIDIALDQNKRIWILEVNTNPFYELFRHHRNKELYGRIKRMMDQIGKFQSDR